MKTPQELKRELNTIYQLQEITQAFEQSAASYIFKMRKKILDARPFFEQAWKTYNIIKFLTLPKEKGLSKRLVLVITPNQGLYGTLLIQVSEKVNAIKKEKHSGDLAVIGGKGKQIFSAQKNRVKKFFDLKDDFSYEDLLPIAKVINEYTDISLIYPKYKSAFVQEVSIAEISSVKKPESHQEVIENFKRYTLDPDLISLNQFFDQTFLAMMLFRYCTEALLAYKAAQMIAMKRAYDNSSEQLEIARFIYYRSIRNLVDGQIREVSAARTIWEEAVNG